MDEQPVRSDRDHFDELAYLWLYPTSRRRSLTGVSLVPGSGTIVTVAKRVAEPMTSIRTFISARIPQRSMRSPRASPLTPLAHYLKFGRARGFLSNAKAPRPADAAATPSRYGGLWPDLPNAADLIEGKLAMGQITERQAEKLTFWKNNGYVILEDAVPTALADKAAWIGPRLRRRLPRSEFECHEVARGHIHWRPEINPHPAKALDIHHFSPAIRDLMFVDAIGEFLGLIFEAKAFASQTLGFLRGSAQEGHQDSAYLPYTIPRQFAATWAAWRM